MKRMRPESRTEAAAITPDPTVARALRALLFACAATVLAATLAQGGAAPVTGAGVRQALHGQTFRTIDGHTTSIEALRGHVVVVNLWASWCGPCRKELPELEALNAEIAKKGGRVLAVSIDLEPRNVQRFVRRLGLTLPVHHDVTGSVARRLDLHGVPYTIVLDRTGDVAYAGHGSGAGELERIKSVTRSLVQAPAVAAASGVGR